METVFSVVDVSLLGSFVESDSGVNVGVIEFETCLKLKVKN